jgi:hypothetical protein
MIGGRIFSAWRGRGLWLALARKYAINDGLYVLVFPDDDRDLNTSALGHVGTLVGERGARGAVVVTSVDAVAREAARTAGVHAVELLSPRAVDGLLALAELADFSPRIMIVSMDKPHGRRLRRLVGQRGVTLEDVVCVALLRIRSWSGAA